MWTAMSIDNIPTAQLPQALEVFSTIITDFDLIIEIGTYKGGFAYWLVQNKTPQCRFLTYEVNPAIVETPEPYRSQMELIIADCFDVDRMKEMEHIIADSGRALILCDGGNKNKEFITFSPFLKTGDVIMLHDYAHDPAEYRKLMAQHNWIAPHESWYDAIKEAVQQNGLKAYMYDDFLAVFWGSFLKGR